MSSVVDIDGKSYVAGCHWHTMEDSPTHQQIIKEATDLDCVWAGQTTVDELTQVAFASDIQATLQNQLGITKNHALAPKIAAAFKAPWVGLFNLDESTWWLVAIGDGGFVLPDGDICGTQEEMKRKYAKHVEDGGWFNTIDNGTLEDIKDYVRQDTNSWSLVFKNISKNANRVRNFAILATLAFLVIPIITTHFYHKYRLKQDMLAAMKMAAALARNQPPVISTALVYGVPSIFLNDCNGALKNIAIENGGWKLIDASCGEKSTLLTWRRENMDVPYKSHPTGLLSADLSRVLTQIPRATVHDLGKDLPSTQTDLQQSYLSLLDLLTNLGIKSMQSSKAVDLEDRTGSKQTVEFSMDFPPVDIANLLDGIKGCRVTDVRLDMVSNTWKIKAAIFSTSKTDPERKNV